MKFLPTILDKTIKRPGNDSGKDQHLVPDPEYSEFWEAFYKTLRSKFNFSAPVLGFEEKINPYFGYFGFRFHPHKKEPKYFHLGIDITDKAKTPIYPILDGVLEYSGFGIVNGNYVFLSHDEVKTEDGFKLYSLYMHLKSASVKFSSYEKMLRQISFNHYPQIKISKNQIIGLMGSTGNSDGMHVHLHLQLEFRDEKGNIVVIDPCEVFGMSSFMNSSANILIEEDFEKFKEENKEGFKKFKID